MRTPTVLWLVVALATAGCRGPTEYPPNIEFEELVRWPRGSSSENPKPCIPGIDIGCAVCAYEQRPDTLPFAVIWLDDHYSRSGGGSENFRDYSSAFRTYDLDNETTVRIDCYKASDKDQPMEFRIDGKKFDLKNGNFFLVSTRGGRVRVHQTKRHFGIMGMRFDRESIMETAKSDGEIQGFFGILMHSDDDEERPH